MRVFGAKPIPETYSVFNVISDIREGSAKVWLNDAFRSFPPSSQIGPYLMGLTHREKGAWKRHYKPDRNEIIPISSIEDEYKALYA